MKKVSYKNRLKAKKVLIKLNKQKYNFYASKFYELIRQINENPLDDRFIILQASYINSETYIPYKCGVCNYIHSQGVKPGNIRHGRGCPSCAGRLPWDRTRFIKTSKKIHKGKYSYGRIPKMEGVLKDKTDISLYCKKCKKYFTQKLGNHIYGKSGCNQCGIERNREKLRDDVSKVKREILVLHRKYIEISFDNYIDKDTNLPCLCKTCKINFLKTSQKLLLGRGCPLCSEISRLSGMFKGKIGYVYSFKIKGKKLWKIGATTDMSKRLGYYQSSRYKIINLKVYKVGKEALNLERAIKAKFWLQRYKGSSKILANGNTELHHTRDIQNYLASLKYPQISFRTRGYKKYIR